MSIDLINRMIYQSSLGNNNLKERVYKWLIDSENHQTSEFIVDNQKYYWETISSKDFSDIIDEEDTNWFYVYSESKKFKAIAKIRENTENLIGEKNKPYITTIWIIESNIESLKITEKPILIWTPHLFDSKVNKIDYDFKQLLTKLRDPKIKITEFVSYKISKELKKRIR